MAIPASAIQWQELAGSGSIAETFTIAAARMVPVAVNVYFKTGTGTAALTVTATSGMHSDYDRLLTTLGDVGNGADASWRLDEGDERQFVIESDPRTGTRGKLSLAWTDPGTATWLIRVGLADASLIDA